MSESQMYLFIGLVMCAAIGLFGGGWWMGVCSERKPGGIGVLLSLFLVLFGAVCFIAVLTMPAFVGPGLQ